MTEKISVIVPAYNAEKTIVKCLNSILNQSYRNLEVLVINDGSTDHTKELVENISDSRIVLISVDNGGVSKARNIGIDHATGEYITFVDSDDFIDPEMYETLIKLIHDYHVDIAHCSYKNVKENGDIISVVGEDGKIVNQNHDDAIIFLLEGRMFAGGLWNKLYHKDLFDGVRLDESIKFNEDVLMNFLLFSQAQGSVYCDKAFYNYTACDNSATHSANQLIANKQMISVAKQICRFSEGKAYEKAAENKAAHCLLELYRAYLFSNIDLKNKEVADVLHEIIQYNEKGFYENRRDKTVIFFYMHFPKKFKFLYRLYDKIRVKKLDPDEA